MLTQKQQGKQRIPLLLFLAVHAVSQEAKDTWPKKEGSKEAKTRLCPPPQEDPSKLSKDTEDLEAVLVEVQELEECPQSEQQLKKSSICTVS